MLITLFFQLLVTIDLYIMLVYIIISHLLVNWNGFVNGAIVIVSSRIISNVNNLLHLSPK